MIRAIPPKGALTVIMDLYYNEITFLTIFVLVIMLLIISKNSLLSGHQRKSLTQLYLMLMFATCCEWMGFFLNGKPSFTIPLHAIVKAMEYSIVPCFCIHFLNIIKLEKRSKWLRNLVGLNIIFEFSSIFTGLVFYIDENNIYQSGSFKWVYTCLCLFCSFYTMAKLFEYGNRFQSNSSHITLMLLSLLLTGSAMRAINPDVRLELLCITFVGIFMYIYYVDILQRSDPLTGLLNRTSYANKLSSITSKLAILYFDIDEFKETNDQYGHVYGDRVLRTVGQAINKVYSRYGSCYRIGGDEFCVILEWRRESIAELNREFEQLLCSHRKTMPNLPTVSIGHSIFDPAKDTLEDAICLADQSMYRTKTKLRKALHETNLKLLASVQAFQAAAAESSILVFIYDLKEQSILVDERTAKVFGVMESQHGIPYETAKMGIVSCDTVAEYIRIHEEMLKGAAKATGMVKLIQTDGTLSTCRLAFRAVLDDDGSPTGTAVGVYTFVDPQNLQMIKKP